MEHREKNPQNDPKLTAIIAELPPISSARPPAKQDDRQTPPTANDRRAFETAVDALKRALTDLGASREDLAQVSRAIDQVPSVKTLATPTGHRYQLRFGDQTLIYVPATRQVLNGNSSRYLSPGPAHMLQTLIDAKLDPECYADVATIPMLTKIAGGTHPSMPIFHLRQGLQAIGAASDIIHNRYGQGYVLQAAVEEFGPDTTN